MPIPAGADEVMCKAASQSYSQNSARLSLPKAHSLNKQAARQWMS